MKKLFLWCKNCQKVTPRDDFSGRCDKCGEPRQAPDKNVPNIFPKGRGF
jgi:Zn finger protein HypA/HybF involved in hydrogenase expression